MNCEGQLSKAINLIVFAKRVKHKTRYKLELDDVTSFLHKAWIF
jgi:hypothetical protein